MEVRQVMVIPRKNRSGWRTMGRGTCVVLLLSACCIPSGVGARFQGSVRETSRLPIQKIMSKPKTIPTIAPATVRIRA
jgi:hypothetical protein